MMAGITDRLWTLQDLFDELLVRAFRLMSAVFRLKNREGIETSASWSLDEQISETSRWLEEADNAELVRGSILDIGFNSRLGDGIAVQGETIPLDFMRQLVALDVTLWLSIYPPFDDTSE